eukprot:COSAG05_NODE_1890_length_3884_cov_26.954029_2_plen_79_part_00
MTTTCCELLLLPLQRWQWQAQADATTAAQLRDWEDPRLAQDQRKRHSASRIADRSGQASPNVKLEIGYARPLHASQND